MMVALQENLSVATRHLIPLQPNISTLLNSTIFLSKLIRAELSAKSAYFNTAQTVSVL